MADSAVFIDHRGINHHGITAICGQGNAFIIYFQSQCSRFTGCPDGLGGDEVAVCVIAFTLQMRAGGIRHLQEFKRSMGQQFPVFTGHGRVGFTPDFCSIFCDDAEFDGLCIGVDQNSALFIGA